MAITNTPNYKLEIRDFTDRLWHDSINKNMRVLDAVINAAFGVANFRGAWANSTAYAIGDRAVDTDEGVVYEAQVAHTSPGSGTFEENREANPTYWAGFTYTAETVDALLAKSLRYPDADDDDISVELPAAELRAGGVLGFDSTGAPIPVSAAITAGVPVHSEWQNVIVDSVDDGLVTAGFSTYVRDNIIGKTTRIAILDELSANGDTITSAATLDLSAATGDTVDVSGSTGITAITLSNGDERRVRFSGTPTLTHSATLILLNNGSNVTVAAGDIMVFRGYDSGVVRCVAHHKLDGQPVAYSGAASTSDLTTSSTKIVTADTITRFVTTGKTIAANTTITVAHGLGVTPFIAGLSMVMGASTELGYSTGDEVDLGTGYIGTENVYGSIALLRDATNITVVFSSVLNINIPHKSTRTGTIIDNTKWTMTVRAMK